MELGRCSRFYCASRTTLIWAVSTYLIRDAHPFVAWQAAWHLSNARIVHAQNAVFASPFPHAESSIESSPRNRTDIMPPLLFREPGRTTINHPSPEQMKAYEQCPASIPTSDRAFRPQSANVSSAFGAVGCTQFRHRAFGLSTILRHMSQRRRERSENEARRVCYVSDR